MTLSNRQSSINNPQSNEWLEISVMTDAETAEVVSDVMSRYVRNGVAIEPLTFFNLEMT